MTGAEIVPAGSAGPGGPDGGSGLDRPARPGGPGRAMAPARPDVQREWTGQDFVWWNTAGVLTALARGRRPNPVSPVIDPVRRAFAADEVMLATCDAELLVWRRGDAVYNPSRGFFLAGGPVGLALTAAFFGGQAYLNSRRRRAARADAVEKWRHLANARLTVSTHGIYLGTGEGIMPISFADVQEVQLTGTGEVVMAAANANGSARWQYRRAGAEFRSQLLETDPVASGDLGLITSPNGRYVAVVATDPTIYSSMSPKWRELDGTSPVTTLVLDAVTGKVILEHPRQTEEHEDTFQLSDSALLDGTVAYSLTDGAQMWDLKDIHLYKDTVPNPVAAYVGSAGHASFIYGYDSGSDSLIVLPQANPSQPRKVTGALQEQEFGDIITARGWIGVYDDRTPTQHHENDDLKARRAHAISLDALSEAPGADTRAFDLGTTLGINAPASLSTGTISVFPATTPDGHPVGIRSLEESSTWKGSSSIGTVFNPATMTVAPLDQSPHYVTAVGITATNIENGTPATNTTDGNSSVITTGDGHITIKTGDSRIIPLAEVEPGSTYYPLKSGEYNSTMKDTAVSRDDYHHISSLSTPGATLAIVNNTPNLPIASQSFRIYGLPG